MNTDPVADLLTRIRNGSRASLPRVDVPYSSLKERLVEVLKASGYLEDYRVMRAKPRDVLEIKLRYDNAKTPVIAGIQRLSSPGLRRYYRSTKLPSIRGGLGTVVLSTSKGLMTDRDARKQGLGGEAMLAIW